MSKDIEIEIQVKVEHTTPLLEFLEKNANFKGEQHQRDEYYVPVHRDFVGVRPVNEWLRLREANGACSINYKFWHRDENGSSTYCDEYETSVGDKEQIKKIFSAMDFTPRIIVDKTRKAWHYKDWEVSLDSVKDLGDFVEIEYKGEDEDVDPIQIAAEMVAFLKSIGCGVIKKNHVGYPFQLLYPDEVKFEIM